MKRHILIIDDDLYIGNVIQEMLEREGYFVTRAYSGTEAVLVLASSRPDLVLLDLMLPGLDGEEVLSYVKGIPVIVLSAKTDVDHKAELLLQGAADYMTKPFHQKELLARIAVQLRNAGASCTSAVLTFDNLTLDTGTHTVTIHDGNSGSIQSDNGNAQSNMICAEQYGQIKLTRTEYAILKLLMQNPTQVITKSQLLDRISEETPDCTESSLKTHISHLRAKLREASGREYIEAVWGIGFKMKEK